MARPVAEQAEPQAAGGDSFEQPLPGASQEPRQRLDERLVIDERVGEAVGLDGVARLRERQMLLRQDALGAEHQFDVVEPLGEAQQEFEAA